MENEYLSLEGVRKIHRISKRKCAWILQNGVIPCEISGKKTRCYKVLRKDVEQYMIMCRQNPVANLLPKIFTSTQGNATTYERIRTALDGFREWLIDLWSNEKNVLNVADVEMLTGYSQTTIARWCQHGTLRHVTVRGDVIIAKGRGVSLDSPSLMFTIALFFFPYMIRSIAVSFSPSRLRCQRNFDFLSGTILPTNLLISSC